MHPKAVHLEGGNNFDRMRININQSLKLQDEWLKSVDRKSLRGSRLFNRISLKLLSYQMKLNLYQPFVLNGLRKKWFDEFHEYWKDCLQGHPLTVMDFHHLYFHYRTKSLFKSDKELEWGSPAEHIAHWQEPDNISLLFHYVLKYALRPVWEARLGEFLKPGFRILEFGCGLAPIYRTYRCYFNHIETQWYLADIPIITFHYDRYTYGREQGVDFICITPDSMDDPLQDIKVDFDLIIMLDVFEHLSRPMVIAEKLLDYLKKDGYFYFNYINSAGKGLDTTDGSKERISTLDFLSRKLRMISGNFAVTDENIPVCIGVKT